MTRETMTHTGKLRSMASVYLRREDKLLMLFRQGKSIVNNLWIGSAGGHFEEAEVNNARACVLRELNEELSLSENDLIDLSLRYVTLRYADGEIRQNYYFFADLAGNVNDCLQSNEGIAQWFALNDLAEIPMPFTARYMIDHYLSTGQYDNKLYGGIANDDGVIFTNL